MLCQKIVFELLFRYYSTMPYFLVCIITDLSVKDKCRCTVFCAIPVFCLHQAHRSLPGA